MMLFSVMAKHLGKLHTFWANTTVYTFLLWIFQVILTISDWLIITAKKINTFFHIFTLVLSSCKLIYGSI